MPCHYNAELFFLILGHTQEEVEVTATESEGEDEAKVNIFEMMLLKNERHNRLII